MKTEINPSLYLVKIRNYKSLANCKIPLMPFTIFVGPNGSGKSNILDALSFVQECLAESIEMALQKRGGIVAVRRRSLGHPTHFSMELTFHVGKGLVGFYFFEIAAKPKERFRISKEVCVLSSTKGPELIYRVEEGAFVQGIPGVKAKIAPDRLALFAASATDEFRPLYDFLTTMRFYSILPGRLRELQEPDSGEVLKKDGSNAAFVLKRLIDENPERYEFICRLLSKVSTGVTAVEPKTMGRQDALQFRQDIGGKAPWKFDALNMSDGTLRVLGLLLSLYQVGNHSLIAIEEPEATVNPAIAEIIFQVLLDVSKSKQILVTTHSPDILDQKELSDESIRVVTMEKGKTKVSAISNANRQAIREKLYTPGELLRIGELESADSK